MNTYAAFYNSREITVQAESQLAAIKEAIEIFKPRPGQAHMVHVHLTEKAGEEVVHRTSDLG